jgi:hypothetical protein
MSLREPLATHCSNPHRDDFWTCPGCYGDLGNVGSAIIVCAECGHKVECTVEYEPACHARIVEGETE